MSDVELNEMEAAEDASPLRERGAALEPDAPAWWGLTSDEALLREALPEHRPEYC